MESLIKPFEIRKYEDQNRKEEIRLFFKFIVNLRKKTKKKKSTSYWIPDYKIIEFFNYLMEIEDNYQNLFNKQKIKEINSDPLFLISHLKQEQTELKKIFSNLTSYKEENIKQILKNYSKKYKDKLIITDHMKDQIKRLREKYPKNKKI